jgi:hypothetical protein
MTLALAVAVAVTQRYAEERRDTQRVLVGVLGEVLVVWLLS